MDYAQFLRIDTNKCSCLNNTLRALHAAKYSAAEFGGRFNVMMQVTLAGRFSSVVALWMNKVARVVCFLCYVAGTCPDVFGSSSTSDG